MKSLAPAAALAIALMAGPALALDAKVESGVKAFAVVEADAEKIKIYCSMSKVMANASEESDAAKSEAAEKEITDLLAKLGPDFQKAWDLGADLNPDSPDGQAMNAALDRLEEKCAK